MSLPDSRRIEYIQALAAVPVPATLPSFSGRAVFRELPVLELEMRGETVPRSIDWLFIDSSLQMLREQRDCQDFCMQGLLRIDYGYADSRLLSADQKTSVRETLLQANYWEDQGAPFSRC